MVVGLHKMFLVWEDLDRDDATYGLPPNWDWNIPPHKLRE